MMKNLLLYRKIYFGPPKRLLLFFSFFLWIGGGWSRFIFARHLQDGSVVASRRRGDTDAGGGLESLVYRKGALKRLSRQN